MSLSARESAPGTAATLLLAASGVAGVLVGSTLDAGTGTAVMATASLVPSVVLGRALGRTRTALGAERWQRHRLAGDVAVSDDQLRRMADRVGLLTDQASDSVAELERTRRQLRRASVELATSRAALAGARAEAARARAALDEVVAARDQARAEADLALAQAEEAARAAARTAREADELARAADAARASGVAPLDGEAWRPVARVKGQRSFASVDLRVFDAFTEADMADEDAVLDAPVRRGRHVAEPQVEVTRGAAASVGTGTTSTTRARTGSSVVTTVGRRDVA